jgi:putative PIN family toxin of toxin-antitoxin system
VGIGAQVVVDPREPVDDVPQQALDATGVGFNVLLLAELRRALAYTKLKDRISPDEADELVELVSRGGVVTQDPRVAPQVSSADPDDNYLIALAFETRSVLVSGDKDLLALSAQIPVYSTAEFLALLETSH